MSAANGAFVPTACRSNWEYSLRCAAFPLQLSQVLSMHLAIAQACAAARVHELLEKGAVTNAHDDLVLLALQHHPELAHSLLHQGNWAVLVILRRSSMYIRCMGLNAPCLLLQCMQYRTASPSAWPWTPKLPCAPSLRS